MMISKQNTRISNVMGGVRLAGFRGVAAALMMGLLLSGCGGAKQSPSYYPHMKDPALYGQGGGKLVGPPPVRYGMGSNPQVRIMIYGAVSSKYTTQFFNDTLPAIPGLGPTGTVTIVYRALVSTESDRVAAIMTACIPAASKRPAFVKAMMKETASMSDDSSRRGAIMNLGREYGVQPARYGRCFANPLLQEWVSIQQKEAKEVLKITQIPTLFINGKKLSGPVKDVVLSEIQAALNAS
ncbi:MAG: thioredoxin domain-containing protein [Magnetococcales bacterium]|nr:thioredoxin domain-containing protein [Magnetococcales bacterium]